MSIQDELKTASEKLAEFMKQHPMPSIGTMEIAARREAEHKALVLDYMTQFNLSESEAEEAIKSGVPYEVLRAIAHYDPKPLIDPISAIITRFGVLPSQKKKAELPKPKRRKGRLNIND